MKPGKIYNISYSYFQKFNINSSLARYQNDIMPYFCASVDIENPNIFWCVPLPKSMEKKNECKITKNNNNLEAKLKLGYLGEVPLVYGTLRGRKGLIKSGEESPNNNVIIADSYLRKLNLGMDFYQLVSFSRKYVEGSLNEDDLESLINYKDNDFNHSAKNSFVSPEANKELMNLMLNKDNIKSILMQLSTTHKDLVNADERRRVLDKFNGLTRGFFSTKTKLILEKTLERNGQIYFSLNEVVMDNEKNIDFNKLKEIFDENTLNYNTVTSEELRFTLESYLDHPNLKFLLDKQVIEIPDDIRRDIRNIIAEKIYDRKYKESFFEENMIPVTEKYNCGIVKPPLYAFLDPNLKKQVNKYVQKTVIGPTNDPKFRLQENAMKIYQELLRELQSENYKVSVPDPFISKINLKTLINESSLQDSIIENKIYLKSLPEKIEKKKVLSKQIKSI